LDALAFGPQALGAMKMPEAAFLAPSDEDQSAQAEEKQGIPVFFVILEIISRRQTTK